MSANRAADFATILAAALIGHDVGDYIAQTNREACEKARPDHNVTPDVPYWRTWAANQRHCLTYHVALTATVFLVAKVTGVRICRRRAAAALTLSYGTHAFIDRRAPVRWLMENAGSGEWYEQGSPHVDQTLHRVALLVAALIAVG